MSRSSRRNQNRIRGPHSALTDFLAANNISARQIRDDYARRLQESVEQGDTAADDAAENNNDDEAAAVNAADQDSDEVEAVLARQRSKKRRTQQEAVLKTKKEKAMLKHKVAAKKHAKRNKKSRKRRGSDDDSDDDSFSDASDIRKSMYRKSKPAPGQFDNCEICEKRFTVTPYSKTGPDGGLLCSPCSKALDKDVKAGKPGADKPNPAAKRRRKVESDRLDGVVRMGPKSLVQTCIETAVRHHAEIDSLDNMPEHLIDKIGQLFTKHRVMNSATLPLFLSHDKTILRIFDCASKWSFIVSLEFQGQYKDSLNTDLKTEDYDRILAELPNLKSLTLHNAYQFKDVNVQYLMEKGRNLCELEVYAANLVSSRQWSELFRARGANLTSIKLTWLDASFGDEQVADLVQFCPSVERLKLENCWLLGEDAINSLTELQFLKHLSLKFIKQISSENMTRLISAIGSHLKTLSLRDFRDLDDEFVDAVHSCCSHLTKLRITENDTITDAGWHSLFTDWDNPPLQIVDVNNVRDVDNQQPDGPEQDPIGLGTDGFKALMNHCQDEIRHLNISGCRHIALSSLAEVFQLGATFPKLEHVDFSFVQNVDDVVLAGVFKASPGVLKRVELFGCFGITTDAIVPRGVVVVGAPRIGIEQEAMEIWGTNDMYEAHGIDGPVAFAASVDVDKMDFD